jgi:hypothetical protein
LERSICAGGLTPSSRKERTLARGRNGSKDDRACRHYDAGYDATSRHHAPTDIVVDASHVLHEATSPSSHLPFDATVNTAMALPSTKESPK